MRQVELVITRLSLRSYSAGRFRSLLLCLGCLAGVGGGIELVSSGPILILLSFLALPSAAVILSASRLGAGVLALAGVCSTLAGVGELAGSCPGAGTGAASATLSRSNMSVSVSDGGC